MKSSVKQNVLLSLVAIAFVGIGAYLGHKATEPGPAEVTAVDVMHAMHLPDPFGVDQKLEQWKNTPVVVNFWATWCAPCVDEMPELQELDDEFAPKGLRVIGIGIDSAANIAQFAEKLNISYPLYVSGVAGNELSRRFGNTSGGLPFTVLIDASGKVQQAYIGRLNMDTLRRDIGKLNLQS